VQDDLSDRLRDLVGYAQEAGAPEAWLTETAHALVAALLERAAMCRALGEVRLKTLQACTQQAALAARLQAAGFTGVALRGAVCARLGISERTYWRRRRDCHARGSGSAVPSGRSPDRRPPMTKSLINPQDRNIGGTMPGAISQAHTKPGFVAPSVPRASDGGGDGTTGGNFQMPANNAGPGFPQQVDAEDPSE
jgi:hypothetical protein